MDPSLSTTLHSRGMRVTPQRLAVLETIQRSRDHLSAEQVFGQVKHKIPNISLATVYKALKELRDVGKVRVLPISGKLRYDALDRPRHHHVVCEGCSQVTDLPVDKSIQDPKIPETARMGFQIWGAEITFRGLCPDCREQGVAINPSNMSTET